MSAGVPRAHAQDVAVRLERPSDIAGIYAVHAASFPSVVEARLVDALRNAGRLTASLVAVEGEVIVGHVAFSAVSVASSMRPWV